MRKMAALTAYNEGGSFVSLLVSSKYRSLKLKLTSMPGHKCNCICEQVMARFMVAVGLDRRAYLTGAS
jgi:hypothetical protein